MTLGQLKTILSMVGKLPDETNIMVTIDIGTDQNIVCDIDTEITLDPNPARPTIFFGGTI